MFLEIVGHLRALVEGSSLTLPAHVYFARALRLTCLKILAGLTGWLCCKGLMVPWTIHGKCGAL